MAGVFSHHAGEIPRGRVFDFLQARGHFFLRHIDIQPPFHNVEGDDIAGFHGCDRPALDGFRGDMSGHQAVCRAGESSVREQCDGIAQACTDDSSGHPKHFSHAGAAGWSFVSNDDDIAGLDLSGLYGFEGIFLALVHFRWPAEMQNGMAGNFDDAALWSQVALENN